MEAIIAAIVVYALFTGLLYVQQRSLMYFPPQQEDSSAAVDLKDFSALKVTTEDGLELTGYFRPPSSERPVIVLFHGNGSRPSWEAFKTRALQAKGYGVMLAEYRGYGGNPGSPSEAGLYSDAEAYIAAVSKAYPDNPLVLYGASLGSAVAVEMAARHKVAAVVLETPIKSALDVADRVYWYVPFKRLIMLDQFRADLRIAQITAPILFILAGRDEVVGLTTGEELYEMANQPKTKALMPEATHAAVYEGGAQVPLIDFMDGVFGP